MTLVSVVDVVFGSVCPLAGRTKWNACVINLDALAYAGNIEDSATQQALRHLTISKCGSEGFSFIEAKAKAIPGFFASFFTARVL